MTYRDFDISNDYVEQPGHAAVIIYAMANQHTKNLNQSPSRPNASPGVTTRFVVPPTKDEPGTDSHLSSTSAITMRIEGGRYDLARELRKLADIIASTHGDPISDAHVIIQLNQIRG